MRSSLRNLARAAARRRTLQDEVLYEGKIVNAPPAPLPYIPDITIPTSPGRQVMQDMYLDYKELYNRHRTVSHIEDMRPKISVQTFIAPNATIVGNVSVSDKVSIWYNAVLRGDRNTITIGAVTNVQDGVLITADDRKNVAGLPSAVSIGNYVTIGHGAILHGCTLQNESYIGMRSIILEGAVVESGAMVAAGAVVPPGRRIPEGELWAGNPARFLRKLSYEEKSAFGKLAEQYWATSLEHSREFLPSGTQYQELQALIKEIESYASKQ